jgi:hypothetical protein
MFINFISSHLAKIDLVGNQVSILHNEQKTMKSAIGGTFTLIIFAFSIFCSVYYGQDLVYKKNPISRFSKEYNPLPISVQDIPHGFYFLDINGFPYTDMEKYVDIITVFFVATIDEKTNLGKITQNFLTSGKCTEESFGNYNSLFTDPKFSIPYKQSYCTNISSYQMLNGTIVENANISILNEYGAMPGRFIEHIFRPCRNTTADKVCATPEEIEKRLSIPLFIGTFMLDYFVDLNNLDNPTTPFTTSYLVSIMKGFTKLVYVKYKSCFIRTDAGYLFQGVDDIESFSQIDEIRNDVSKVDDNMLSFYFDVNKINDVYYRRYVKIQDILAQVGGLIKLLFTVSSFLMMYPLHNRLLIELGNSNFKLNKDIRLNKIENHSIDRSSKNPITDEFFGMKKTNNFVSSKPCSSEKIEMNLNDNFRAICKCKARYTKDQYKFLKIAIMNNLEITNFIRSNLMIDKINRTLFPADDAREMIIPKMNERMRISDDRECKLLLKSLSIVLSNEVVQQID